MPSTFTPSDVQVNHFNRNVNLLAQQEASMLSGAVRMDGQVIGNLAFFDSYGQVAMQERTSPDADTQLQKTPRLRRAALVKDFEHAELVPNEDQLRTLHDINNPLRTSATGAAGVRKDTSIIEALTGSAREDQAGSTLVALPAAQKVLAGGTGLTFNKVRDGVKVLKSAHAFNNSRMGGLWGVIDADTEAQLLSEAEVKSSDFTVKRILDTGTLHGMSWMGVNWIVMGVTEGAVLPNNGSSERLVYFWSKNSLGLAQAQDITSTFDRRPDKSNAMQLLVKWHGGAVRIDDKGVVEVANVV